LLLPRRGFLLHIAVGLPGTRPERLAEFAVQGFRLLNTNVLPALPDLTKLAMPVRARSH
jgi:hypothetical protein